MAWKESHTLSTPEGMKPCRVCNSIPRYILVKYPNCCCLGNGCRWIDYYVSCACHGEHIHSSDDFKPANDLTEWWNTNHG